MALPSQLDYMANQYNRFYSSPTTQGESPHLKQPPQKQSIGKRICNAVRNAFSELFCRGKQEKWIRLPGKWYEPGLSEKATGCFHALMPPHSQRENWNTVTPYITEFWSTLTNVGFFAVGAVYGEPLLMLAGIFSTLQHANPKAWLVKADQTVATLATLAIGIRHCKGFYNEPLCTIPIAAGVATTFAFDMHNAEHCHYNFVHPLWHTAATCGCLATIIAADGDTLW